MKSMVKIIGPFFKMWSLYIEYHNSLKKKILIFGRLTDSHCYIGTCIRNKSISFKITSWHDTATALYFQGFFKGNLSSCLKKARRPNLSRSPLILFICIIAPKNEKKTYWSQCCRPTDYIKYSHMTRFYNLFQSEAKQIQILVFH